MSEKDNFKQGEKVRVLSVGGSTTDSRVGEIGIVNWRNPGTKITAVDFEADGQAFRDDELELVKRKGSGGATLYTLGPGVL